MLCTSHVNVNSKPSTLIILYWIIKTTSHYTNTELQDQFSKTIKAVKCNFKNKTEFTQKGIPSLVVYYNGKYK